jgi:hypothetical protein
VTLQIRQLTDVSDCNFRNALSGNWHVTNELEEVRA